MTRLSAKPLLRAWLILSSVLALVGGVLFSITASQPDTALAKVAVVLTPPGGAVYFTVGCSPHTEACGAAFGLVLISVVSGIVWATVLVALFRVAVAARRVWHSASSRAA